MDTGLQPERTVLAWRRTQMSLLLVACLALRCLLQRPAVAMAVMTLAVAAAWLIALGQRCCYRRARRGMAQPGIAANPVAVFNLAMGVVLIAVLALVAGLSLA